MTLTEYLATATTEDLTLFGAEIYSGDNVIEIDKSRIDLGVVDITYEEFCLSIWGDGDIGLSGADVLFPVSDFMAALQKRGIEFDRQEI